MLNGSSEVGFSLEITRHLVALVVIALSLVTMVLFQARTTRGRVPRFPPVAPGGFMHTLKKVTGADFPWFVLQNMKDLKSKVFRLALPIPGTPMFVVVGGLETARTIFADPLTWRPEFFSKPFELVFGHRSVFTSNHKHWETRRRSTVSAFAMTHIRRMNRVALKKTELWIEQRLKPCMEQDESFDVGKEMLSITLSALCETAFEYNMQEDELVRFRYELDLTLKEFLFKSILNPFRNAFGPFLPERRRAFKAAQYLMHVAANMLANYRSLQHPTKDTIIDRVANSDIYQNDGERIAELLTYLIAGHETTGNSLAWILLELARNPSESKALRHALSQIPPEDWSRSDVLNRVVREGIRLHPVSATGSIRQIGRDMISHEEEYFLPKGSIVFCPFILFMRNPDIFVNETSFDPSRWENPTKEMNDAFFPFSLGRQNCIGQSLAKAEVHSIVARICAEFELEVCDEGTVDYFLTLKPIGALLKAHKAQ